MGKSESNNILCFFGGFFSSATVTMHTEKTVSQTSKSVDFKIKCPSIDRPLSPD